MSVVVSEAVWEFASAGGVGTGDRPFAAVGESDGDVNFAASVALEPGVPVVVLLKSAT